MSRKERLQKNLRKLAQEDPAGLQRMLAEDMAKNAPDKDLEKALEQYFGALEWLQEESYHQASAEVVSLIKNGDFDAAERVWERAEKYGEELIQRETKAVRARGAEMLKILFTPESAEADPTPPPAPGS